MIQFDKFLTHNTGIYVLQKFVTYKLTITTPDIIVALSSEYMKENINVFSTKVNGLRGFPVFK